MPDPGNDDRRLLEALKTSDVGAFRTLFETYQPLLFRSFLGRTGDADLAHDIVQETFTRVWENRSRLKPRLPFYPYIFRIGTNLLRDHLRHARAGSRAAGEAAAPLYPDPPSAEETLDVRRLEEKIHSIVHEDLPERCRMIFLLSRTGGKSNREIAAMLNVSLKTVENQLTHALGVLRRGLGRKV